MMIVSLQHVSVECYSIRRRHMCVCVVSYYSTYIHSKMYKQLCLLPLSIFLPIEPNNWLFGHFLQDIHIYTHPRHWNITKFGVNVRHGLTLTNLATPIDSRSSRSFYSLLLLFLFALLTRRLQLKSSLHFSIEVRSWSYIWWDWCSNHHTHIHTTWTDHSVCVCLCILYHGRWQH